MCEAGVSSWLSCQSASPQSVSLNSKQVYKPKEALRLDTGTGSKCGIHDMYAIIPTHRSHGIQDQPHSEAFRLQERPLHSCSI